MTSSLLPQQAPLLACPIALLLGIAFVVQLLALGEPQLHLRPALRVEGDFERHKRHALAIDGLAKLRDLPFVQQQFPRPPGLVVEAISFGVFRDVAIDEEDFPALRMRIGIADRGLAAAQRLHLCAGQHDTGLHHLFDEVVVPRLAVVRRDLDPGVLVFFRSHRGDQFNSPAFVIAARTFAFDVSESGANGRRTVSSHLPSRLAAYFTGEGDVSQNNVSCSGINRSCNSRAVA